MKRLFRKPSPTLGLYLLLALVLTSCGRYQMGSPGTLEISSVFVQPVINESFAPQAQALLTGQIRDAFIRDGRVRLTSSPDDADGVLQIVLTDFRRSTRAFDAEDTINALTSDLELEAKITLFKGDSAETFFAGRSVRNSSTVYARNVFADSGSLAAGRQDTLGAEYEEMPRLTRELARRIADEVLNAW